MNVKVFSKRMTELMPKFVRGLAKQESNHLTRGQITVPQFWVLEHLEAHRDCCMCEIASYLGISRPATTGLVDRLISQGLACRKSAPHDRREVKVSISPKGKRIVLSIHVQKRHTIERIFSKISSRDRKNYITILERVASIVQQQPLNAKDAYRAKAKN